MATRREEVPTRSMSIEGSVERVRNHGTPSRERVPSTTPARSSPSTGGWSARAARSAPSLAPARIPASARITVGTRLDTSLGSAGQAHPRYPAPVPPEFWCEPHPLGLRHRRARPMSWVAGVAGVALLAAVLVDAFETIVL